MLFFASFSMIERERTLGKEVGIFLVRVTHLYFNLP